MADPVKTILLKALETLLRAWAPEVPTVRRDWQFPLDMAKATLPVLLFYEDDERLGSLGSQVAKNVIDLDLVVFAAFSRPYYEEDDPTWQDNDAWQEFKAWADALAGKIHGFWHDRTQRLALKAAGLMQVEELGQRKAPANGAYGELVLSYRLTYGHALGDAFTTAIH